MLVFDKERTATIMEQTTNRFEVILGLRFEGLVGVWNLKLGGLLLPTATTYNDKYNYTNANNTLRTTTNNDDN